MARRKKKRTTWTSRLRDRMTALVPQDLDWLATTRRVTLALFAVAAVLALVLALPRLERRAAAAAWPTTTTVEFAEAPAWVTGDVADLLARTAGHALAGNVFDQRELAATRSALLETGWFESIEQVRRLQPGLVRVEGRYVRPAAVVRDDEGDHLVDTRGRLLPRTYPHGGAVRQVVITGVQLDHPEETGVAWPGADLAAGLRLLRIVTDKPWQQQIVSIDVARYLETQTLVIVTDLPARIIWGSAPGDETALEVVAKGKLAYLDKAYEQFGRIDTGHRGELRFYEQGFFAE